MPKDKFLRIIIDSNETCFCEKCLTKIFLAVACTFCFVVGLIFTTGAGEYFLTLFDTYGAMGLTLIALIEIMSVMYIYGHAQFTDDIEEMTGVRPGIYWQLCWRLISPALLALVLVSSVVMSFLSTPTYTAWNKELVRY